MDFKRVLVVGTLAIGTVALLAMVSSCKKDGPALDTGDSDIVVGTEANFAAEVLQSKVPVLLDFSATWCPPCRMLHPNLVTIASEYSGRAKVVTVDVDQAESLARKYEVRGIPAMFIIVNGEQVDNHVGYLDEAQLRQLLDKHLN